MWDPTRQWTSLDFPLSALQSLRLLLLKRTVEICRPVFPLLLLGISPLAVMALLTLSQLSLPPGLAEGFVAPVAIAYWLFSLAETFSRERRSGLLSTFHLVGVPESLYFLSYCLSDAIVLGLSLSLWAAVLVAAQLFNGASYASVFSLFFCSILALVPFVYLLSALEKTLRISIPLLWPIYTGSLALYLLVFVLEYFARASLAVLEGFCCLLPPFAMHLACGSFRDGRRGLGTSVICALLAMDAVVYALLSYTWSRAQHQARGRSALREEDMVSGIALQQRLPTHDVDAEQPSPGWKEMDDDDGGESPPILHLHRVKVAGLQEVSFRVLPQELFVLYGPVQSGKTAILEAIADWRNYEGIIDKAPEASPMLYIASQTDQLIPFLTVEEHVHLFSQLCAMYKREAHTEAMSMLSMLRMEETWSSMVSTLTPAQCRKLSVVLSLLCSTQLVMIDEPTTGLDELEKLEMFTFLRDARRGRSLMIATSDAETLEALADRALLLQNGAITCSGSLLFLRQTFRAGYHLHLRFVQATRLEARLAIHQSIKQLIAEVRLIQSSVDWITFCLPLDHPKFAALFTWLEGVESIQEIIWTRVGLETAMVEAEIGTDTVEATHEEVEDSKCVATAYQPKPLHPGQINWQRQFKLFCWQHFRYLYRDLYAFFALLFPVWMTILIAILRSQHLLRNRFVVGALYTASYLPTSALVARRSVAERCSGWRTILRIYGAKHTSYLGALALGEYLLYVPLALFTCLLWRERQGEVFILLLSFHAAMLQQAYLLSYVFVQPWRCAVFMPALQALVVVVPVTTVMVFMALLRVCGVNITGSVQGTSLLWMAMLTSPHAALFSGFLVLSDHVSNALFLPPLYAILLVLLFTSALYFRGCLYVDQRPPSAPPALPTLLPLSADQLVERDQTAVECDDETLRVRNLSSGKQLREVSLLLRDYQQLLLLMNAESSDVFFRLLSNQLRPSAGDIFLFGQPLPQAFAQHRHRFGFMAQQDSLCELLTVQDQLQLLAQLHQVSVQHVDQLLEQCELRHKRMVLARDLTYAERRRLSLCLALVNDPQLLLLDQPALRCPVDHLPQLWRCVERASKGRSVLLTSESWPGITLARIGMMLRGRLEALGDASQLQRRYGSCYELHLLLLPHAHAQIASLRVLLSQLCPAFQLLANTSDQQIYELPRLAIPLSQAFQLLSSSQASLGIKTFQLHRPSLAKVYRDLVKDEQWQQGRLNEGLVLQALEMEISESDLTQQARLLNKCGCSNSAIRWLTIGALVLALIFAITSLAVAHRSAAASQALVVFALLLLLFAVAGVLILTCSCFQKKKLLELLD